MELILHDIWSRRLRQDAAIPVIVVLDECQKFSFGPNNATTQLLRQGRKYKMSGWFASQWITNKEAINALDQAALRAYFRPESSNLHALARRLSSVDKSRISAGKERIKEYERHLSCLKVGQFLYQDKMGHPIIANVPAQP